MYRLSISKEALDHFMSKQAGRVRELLAQRDFEAMGGIDAMGEEPPSSTLLTRAARQLEAEKRVAGDYSSELSNRLRDKGPIFSFTKNQRKAKLDYIRKRLQEVRDKHQQRLDKIKGSESKTV